MVCLPSTVVLAIDLTVLGEARASTTLGEKMASPVPCFLSVGNPDFPSATITELNLLCRSDLKKFGLANCRGMPPFVTNGFPRHDQS